MFKFALFILLAISSSQAFWYGCPGILAPIIITSPVCSGTSCRVVPGTSVTFSSTIKFTRAHSHLMTRLTVFIGGVGIIIPQNPPHDNACNALFVDGVTSGCPTVPNVPTRYDLYVMFSSGVPPSRTDIKYELLENGKVEVCANIVLYIVAA